MKDPAAHQSQDNGMSPEAPHDELDELLNNPVATVDMVPSVILAMEQLLQIAEVAMPADLFAIDPRIINAQELLAMIKLMAR